MKSRTRTSGTQSIERAVIVLKALAAIGPEGVKVTDLASRTSLAYPTLYRILQCLVAEGLAHRDSARRYTVGQLLYELSLRAPPQMNLRDCCASMISRIAQQTGDTVFLNVRSGADSVCIDRREGAFPIKTLVLEIGHRRPLGVGAAGLALLMALPQAEAERILAATKTLLEQSAGMSLRRLNETMDWGRELGYIFLQDTVLKGVGVLSVPFKPRGAFSPAAVSVASITSRMVSARRKDIVHFIQAEVAHLGVRESR
jgi:DNA-binding IclR family transcriptional regulator